MAIESMYARLNSNSILEGTRLEVLRKITNTPGITATEIAGLLCTSQTNVRTHLDILKHFGYVAERPGPRKRRCYFPIDETTTFEGRTLLAQLTNPTARDIFEYVLHNGPTSSKKEVADNLGISYTGANHHIETLIAKGAMTKEPGHGISLAIPVDVARTYEQMLECVNPHQIAPEPAEIQA